MPGFSPFVAAVIVTIAAFVVSGVWFGVHRRRLAETDAGVAALAGMKWRECAGLVLQALGEKGFREAPSSRQPGDGGSEFLLVKGDERCLLSYKHGTAYRLGEANVRDFANAVQLQGATSGILVTLGSAEGFARDIARRYGVSLIDGRSLWPQVEPFAPAAMVAAIRQDAAGAVRRGQRIGLLASIGVGVVAFFVVLVLQSAGSHLATSVDTSATTTPAAPATRDTSAMEKADAAAGVAPAAATGAPIAPAPAPEFSDPAAQAANEALQELAEVAQLTDAERNQRRVTAASRIGELPDVESAVWSTQSTLTIRMERTDGVDDALVASACGVLAEYEEIRYSRLQLEAPAGDSKAAPVRWRVCQ